ncbi:UDP-N-acetylenolpyruvoylglucosamine reductase [Parasponia andersonii]|uniref:UDP-N-acetylmuramate dehydrogenase n=1 Tax=Parasponia andersonii TaxID=3476 RepID=A0A2P5B4J1_PARAD|nr:UDP-N-acetylenolpyruvoylglucosamine reductase [Parasponia andersonii]
MAIPLCYGPNPHLLHSRANGGTPLCNYSGSHDQTTDNHLAFIRGKKLLKDLSTWGIGGACRYFTQVFDPTQLVSAIRYCQEHSLRFMVIGKGSNCLFDDLGFDGCVILNRMEFLEMEEPGVYKAGSGFRFNRLGVQCSNEGFTGLEFAGGIPGTVGGATYVNAGANGQETADVVESVDFVTFDGRLRRLERADLKFGYRSSPFQRMPDLAAIVAVTFRLQSSGTSKTRLQEYLARRRASQPIGERSAGSVFRNSSDLGVAAGEFIEKAGLKGFRVGGAMISKVHANFFVNSGGSTSQDMLDLIAVAKDKVYQKFGVQLKEEILYVNPSKETQ